MQRLAVASGFHKKLACWLEYSFVTREADGFKMPTARIRVGVRAQDLSGFVPSRLEMFIKRNISINAIPNLIPHELFHNVQLQYWDIHHPHLWFREPMAQAMAASMVPEPCAGTFDCNPESFYIHANGTPWTHDLFHFPRAAWVDSYDSPSRPTRRGWSTS